MKSFNLSDYLAKPDGTTLHEHVNWLLNNLETLKALYGDRIELTCPEPYRPFLWKSLELACRYHDHGKMCSDFQKAMKKGVNPSIRHNCLSPAFFIQSVPEVLSDVPEDIKSDLIFLICNAILYHHHRLSKVEDIENVLREEFGIDGLNSLVKHQINKGEYGSMDEYFRDDSEELYGFYYLLKGLLLRIDHASSAKILVEKDPLHEVFKVVEQKIKNLKPFQRQVYEERDKNLILKAPTGSGKTEAGLLFMDSKGFFVLPVITSINAMYERFVNLFGSNKVGLLHSNAFSYLYSRSSEDNTVESIYEDVEYANNFAYPLLVCTPEQILPFVLRFKGFEKYYSVLSYSRLVIDEVHAYDPVAMAYVFKAVEHTVKLGGKALVMSATIPDFLERDFINLGFELIEHEEEDIIRHRIALVDKPVEEATDSILELSQKGKVLVIVNTVSKAQELCRKLEERSLKVYLLHSRFIQRDKRRREKVLRCAIQTKERGIFITTQLAEVSLDISADYLITELSTIDSLIQRMGRVNRRGEKGKPDSPNVFVYTQEPSGVGSVYHKDLVQTTLEALKPFDRSLLSEKDKRDIVNRVFAKVDNFRREYEDTKVYVDRLWELNGYIEPSERKEAMKNFRRIFSLSVVPQIYKEKVSSMIKEFSREKGIGKLKVLMKISDYCLPVPYYLYLQDRDRFLKISELKGYNIYWFRGNYSKHLGLLSLADADDTYQDNIL
ncbi:MAG: CRISPR-associated helicase Cas3' [Aquificaceae bacterium]|jgi:CRISPR-associated endonuclease/helicase Cas3|uniref:CRISPR-associated helicase Cas3' n=1 Tax=Hydrogenobacter sp. Uz 6-8 TaxID=3384828 RepID=UPI0030B12E17